MFLFNLSINRDKLGVNRLGYVCLKLSLVVTMKYIPLVVLIFSTTISFILMKLITLDFDLFYLWVLAPHTVALTVAILKLMGCRFTAVVPITGAIITVFSLPFYYESYQYGRLQDTAGLIFSVMPIYQSMVLIAAVLLSSGYRYLSKN